MFLVKSTYLEVISSCNKRCSYCYNAEMLKRNIRLSIDAIRSYIDEFVIFGGTDIIISGGEPFLYPFLCEVLEYAKKKVPNVQVVTNFTIFDERIFKTLVDKNANLYISLDGPNSQTHDNTRGKNSFSEIQRNINKLLEMGYAGKLKFRMNLHRENLFHICDMFEYLLNFRYDNMSLDLALVNNMGLGDEFVGRIAMNDMETLHFINDKCNYLNARNLFPVNFSGLNCSIGCPYFASENIECNFRIDPLGNVYPCQLFVDSTFILGNINYESITDILSGVKMEYFLNLLKIKKHFTKECLECAFQNVCNGGCPASALNQNKTIFSTNNNCKLIKDNFFNILSKDN